MDFYVYVSKCVHVQRPAVRKAVGFFRGYHQHASVVSIFVNIVMCIWYLYICMMEICYLVGKLQLPLCTVALTNTKTNGAYTRMYACAHQMRGGFLFIYLYWYVYTYVLPILISLNAIGQWFLYKNLLDLKQWDAAQNINLIWKESVDRNQSSTIFVCMHVCIYALLVGV